MSGLPVPLASRSPGTGTSRSMNRVTLAGLGVMGVTVSATSYSILGNFLATGSIPLGARGLRISPGSAQKAMGTPGWSSTTPRVLCSLLTHHQADGPLTRRCRKNPCTGSDSSRSSPPSRLSSGGPHQGDQREAPQHPAASPWLCCVPICEALFSANINLASGPFRAHQDAFLLLTLNLEFLAPARTSSRIQTAGLPTAPRFIDRNAPFPLPSATVPSLACACDHSGRSSGREGTDSQETATLVGAFFLSCFH